MNEKEIALKLIQDFYHLDPEDSHQYGMEWQMAKQCATICVDEIIKNHLHKIIEKYYVDIGGNKTEDKYFELVPNELFWEGVKQEIEKL